MKESEIRKDIEEGYKNELNKTLKQSYLEWKNIHNQKIRKMDESFKEVVEKRIKEMRKEEVKKSKKVIEEKVEGLKNIFIKKENEMKEYYDQMMNHKISEVDYQLRTKFEHDKQLLELEMKEKLEKYKKVRKKNLLTFFSKSIDRTKKRRLWVGGN
jgi:succinate dehydrogenase flavin-adding protein (antitoxin of CptAB toxin-antitoxin module)